MEHIRRSELQAMLAGGIFLAPDDECDAREQRATALLDELNATPMSQMRKRITILKQALIRYDPGLMRSPVRLAVRSSRNWRGVLFQLGLPVPGQCTDHVRDRRGGWTKMSVHHRRSPASGGRASPLR